VSLNSSNSNFLVIVVSDFEPALARTLKTSFGFDILNSI
jgi:hypothetical protein